MRQEIKDKISKKMKKQVLNFRTGDLYDSLTEVCENQNLNYSDMSNKLSGKKSNTTDFVYAKIQENIFTDNYKSDSGEFKVLHVFKNKDYELMCLVELPFRKIVMTSIDSIRKYLYS